MKEVVEIESIEQEPKLSPEITTDRLPDGQLTRSETLEGDDGVVSVSKDFYCGTRTFDFVVSASFADPENAPSLVLRPHGGPDPGTDEYTEVGFRYLEPDAEGQAEAAIYDLPEVAVYEIVERTELTDDTTETADGLITTISGPLFDMLCEDIPEPAPEIDDKDPDADIEESIDDSYGADSSPESSDDVEPVDPIDGLPIDDEATESQATVIESQPQDPNAEMPKIGSDTVLMVALGAAAAVAGITQLRKTRYLRNK